MKRTLTLSLAGLATAACADQPIEGVRGIQIAVAPLSLPGIGEACYDIQVNNGTDIVWSLGDPDYTKLGANQADNNGPGDTLVSANEDDTTVCSGQFGNTTGGDITYIGPCDASEDSDNNPGNGNQNEVLIWIDGLYNEAGTADIGQWRDPCGTAGCALQVDCDPNADTLAEFNFAIMRDANQGFFDIAVNFEDVFCSAKFDTCYETTPERRINLIHGSDSVRDWTGVFGFACTAGADSATADIVTHLLMSQVSVTCGTDTFVINPRLAEGKQDVTVAGKTLNYAIYRGQEDLDCPTNDCNSLYWNLALSLDDLIAGYPAGSCTLTLEATADDATSATTGVAFANGLPQGNGVSYPYVAVSANLTNNGVGVCQKNGLNTNAVVQTVYKGNLGGLTTPVVMCSSFDGTTATATGGAGCL